MVKLRKIKINEEFLVKIAGVVETEDSDENVQSALDELNGLIKKWIENNITPDCTVIVEPVTRCWECKYEHNCRVHEAMNAARFPDSKLSCSVGVPMPTKRRNNNG